MTAWALPPGAVPALAARFVALGLSLNLSLSLAASADPAPASAPESSAVPPSSHDQAQLINALHAADALWQSLGEVRGRLLGNAERALDQADQASTLDERQRQEALYRQLSDRLAELDQTRAELKTQLDLLRQQLDVAPAPPRPPE